MIRFVDCNDDIWVQSADVVCSCSDHQAVHTASYTHTE